MASHPIPSGTVHDLPADLRTGLVANKDALVAWEGITPLARNEWICWVEDAKKPETRRIRIARVSTELVEGKRRPCCWPGWVGRETPGLGLSLIHI